jgi:ubiquinone/menaquinone biosynthesis C-methylase UbiE
MSQRSYWERQQLLKRRNPNHPVVAACVLPKIALIKKNICISKDSKILEVGCGNGFFTYYLDKFCDVCGIDNSEKMLQMNPVKNVSRMDANDLKFNDNSFDVVFCSGLLHHVNNIDAILDEMKRVSKKYVVILEPNRNNLFMFLFLLIVNQERKALKFSLSYLQDKIRKKGLRIIDSFSQGMIVPNKTPTFMLPLLKCLDFKQPWGITNCIIAEKI